MNKISAPAIFALAIGCSLVAAFVLGRKDSHAAPASIDYAAIEAYIQKQMQEWQIPGAALVIVQDDQIVHVQPFGRDATHNPVGAQTLFEIGSCTKSFTALAIMQLAEQGKLELDDPVQRYLPWFQMADAEASRSITLRHLLNHSSGIPARILNTTTMLNPNRLTLEGQVRLLQKQPPIARPGEIYQYSNLNYMTLALVIEQAAGQPYGEYVQQNIFAPLGMKNSFTDVDAARRQGFAGGHTWWFGLPFKSLEGARPDMLGAGYLVTNAEDMAHSLVAQLNGGVYGEARVLSAQGVETMHQPTQLAAEKSVYGMGWVSYEENGLTIINHNGQSASFTAAMILVPEKQLGLAVLTNVSGGLSPHPAWSLADNVKNMLLTGQPAEVGPAYRDFYLPWNGGFLAATLLLLGSLVGLPGWGKKLRQSPPKSRGETFRRVALPIGVDVLFSLAALLGLPFTQGYAVWRALSVWQPDAFWWCLAAGVLLAAKAIGRALWWKKRW